MESLVFDATFADWQKAARVALARSLTPDEVIWQPRQAAQPELGLFAAEPLQLVSESAVTKSEYKVPRDFLPMAKLVACHRDEARWSLLYRVLWRLTHNEGHLLDVATDPDVIELAHKSKAIRHDMHKMRAFARFREVMTADGPWFVAWFEPHHHIVEVNASFFVERFATMNWSILTPDRCAHWDQHKLTFTDGVTRDQAPSADETEDLWRTYYRHIFNPARVKIAAMKKEMAPYYWKNLPEAKIIPDLLAEAPLRTARMVEASRAKAPVVETYGPAPVPSSGDWNTVREAALTCHACPLWRNATCTVFGEGPITARVMVVGEQPGDQEDRLGQAFVGPAGKLLDRALAAASIDRSQLYVTNAVKHFKWEPQGKRRLHQKPNSREVAACRPWLEREIELIRPTLLVCLGGTAAQSVLGHSVKVTEERGKLFDTEFGIPALVTVHPSALLRQPDATRAETDFAAFTEDLRKIATAFEDGASSIAG